MSRSAEKQGLGQGLELRPKLKQPAKSCHHGYGKACGNLALQRGKSSLPLVPYPATPRLVHCYVRIESAVPYFTLIETHLELTSADHGLHIQSPLRSIVLELPSLGNKSTITRAVGFYEYMLRTTHTSRTVRRPA